MSQFDFIATDDYELIDLLGSNDDYLLNECHVYKVAKDETYEDVKYYTDLPYIYEIYWKVKENQCQQLIEYLKTHMKCNKKYELNCIWLANAKNRRIYKQDIENGLHHLYCITMNIHDCHDEMIRKLYHDYQYLKIRFYKSKKY